MAQDEESRVIAPAHLRHPDELQRLRTEVTDWLRRANSALLAFRREQDNSFWRDSRKRAENKEDLSTTTTSRSYMALAEADRCLATKKAGESPAWIESFHKFLDKDRIWIEATGEARKLAATGDPAHLNNFEIAHLADLLYVANYVNRFYQSQLSDLTLPVRENLEDSESSPERSEPLDEFVGEFIASVLEKRQESAHETLQQPTDAQGRLAFEATDGGEWSAHHHFVTLHSLRALAVLDRKLDQEVLQPLVEQLRTYCVEQCFLSQRGNRHEQDIFSLTFSGVAYILYGRDVDSDLCMAIIEAISQAQREDGRWPGTHPIFRKGGSQPWHITSHEIALCLTWLYFQPRLPESARDLLLGMMENYFNKWVKGSFVRSGPPQNSALQGWFADHARSTDLVEGWATAVVCHFLSNYLRVLNDHINRRVVETLALQSVSSHYLISETAHKASERWSRDQKGQPATWPDLPPFSCKTEPPKAAGLQSELCWRWTDPSENAEDSKALATKVLAPIFQSPGERPEPSLTSGVLAGEPGTRKTTLVKTIAGILEWPLVTVPASVIFDRGFDLMEARATEVFRLLNYLTGCVVFFDEWEEFFRKRPWPARAAEPEDQKSDRQGSSTQDSADGEAATPDSIHDRTIAAFTTSSMLPRLQDLHDQNRCLVFLATNHADQIDAAIRRPGRFDFKITVDFPSRERLLAYLKAPTRRTLQDLGLEIDDANCSVDPSEHSRLEQLADAVGDALKKAPDGTSYYFPLVESALREAAGMPDDSSRHALCRAASEAIDRWSKQTKSDDHDPPELRDLLP